MAKQAGDFFIEGTFDDLTFYKMCGVYYLRMKTSLTGKRFWRDKVFEGSRKSCSRFGEGNKLASVVFKMVEEEKRTNRLFPFLRTRAIALLKEGKAAQEVMWLLVDYLVDFGFIEIRSVRKENRCVDFSFFHFCLDTKVEQKVKDSINRSANLSGQRHCSTPIIFSSA